MKEAMVPKAEIRRLTTIDHLISQEVVNHPQASGEFALLFHDLTLAIRIIAAEARRAGINDVLGFAQTSNIHGEKQQKLDKLSNEIIKASLIAGGHVCAIASEEDVDITFVEPKDYSEPEQKYIIILDPLDGSMNINVNVTIGTIFSIYRRLDNRETIPCTKADVLQPGDMLVAAGYALYGSSTVLVYTTGNGVNMFTYDPLIGEFLLTNKSVQIPKTGRYYGVNEGNYFLWDQEVRDYVNFLKTPSEDKKYPYTLRYIGTSISDLHRTLLYGGIIMYPNYSTLPEGKMRLVYEAIPLSFIIEQAGGRATDGKMRILEKTPTSVHEHTPLYLGSPEDMDKLDEFLKKRS